MGHAEDAGGDRDAESGEDRPFVPASRPRQHSSAQNKPINGFFSIHRHMMESDSKSTPRRNKRKQLSPRRSSCDDDDYLTEKAYLPSWSTGTLKTVPLRPDGGWGNVTNYKQMKILFKKRKVLAKLHFDPICANFKKKFLLKLLCSLQRVTVWFADSVL